MAHFLVDFACTAALALGTGGLRHWDVALCAILYNGLAFAFQLPIGALADCGKLHRGLAALGCLLVALGVWIPRPVPMCLAIGLGNACFHVGGGREALKRGGKKAAQVGRFVAPGALGIFLGPRLSGLRWLGKGLLPGCLLVLAAVLWKTTEEGQQAEERTMPATPVSRGKLAVACACMFLTVLLRSYLGTVLQYPFLTGWGGAAVFTLCIFGGKYFGGILADRFGTIRFCLGAQIAGTLLFPLSIGFPVLAMPAIFLFNTTMAVTAAKLYGCLPQFPGTMFGLTTFALYLGVLPRLLKLGWNCFTPLGLGGLSLLSGVLLMCGLILLKGGSRCGDPAAALAGEIPGPDAGC